MSSIDFFFEDIDPFLIHKKILISHLNLLIKKELKLVGEVSVVFCSDMFLLEMNKQYLEHDYYTDIITFDYVEDDVISGDLFISIDRIKENAESYENEFIKELFRVVFHGFLHLVGYKDKTEEEQQLMTEKENYYLSGVDFKGLDI